MFLKNKIKNIFYLFLFFYLTKSQIEGPLTNDFQNWLSDHEYYEDLAGFGTKNSFGGRTYKGQPINKRPVVFIHGNSDGALAIKDGEWDQGWTDSISYFMKEGIYTTAELYALTYGNRQINTSLENELSCGDATRLRRFVNAVFDYTSANEIDIIAHSMGVTYARIIIQGDLPVLHRCKLGKPLNERIKNFIAIAGANYGLCICTDNEEHSATSKTPACGKEFGFWTGPTCPMMTPVITCERHDLLYTDICRGNYGAVLKALNKFGKPKDAKYIASFWSSDDQIIGSNNQAFGYKTSIVPGTDKEFKYSNLTHYTLKSKTVNDQLKILQQE